MAPSAEGPKCFRVRLPSLAAAAVITLMLALAGCATTDSTPTEQAGSEPTATSSEPGTTPDPTPTEQPSDEFDAAAYFEGRTIRIISPAAPGGGYDLFARILARVAPNHIPGNPNIVVENQTGGGLLRGLQAAMRAEPDGFTVGQLHPRWVQAQILGNPPEGFDFNTAMVLGSPTFAAASSLWCIDRSLATSWEGVLELGREVTSGETERGNSPGPEFVEAIGGPITNVYGYGGSSEIMAAFDRGELDGTTRCGAELVERLYPEWVEQERFMPVFYYGTPPDPEWLETIGAEEPPHVLDITEHTEQEQAAFETYMSLVRAQRVFLLPPEVPEEVYEVWLEAFNNAVEDPEFVEAVSAAGYADDYELGTAQEVRDSFGVADGLSDEARDLLAEMTGQ